MAKSLNPEGKTGVRIVVAGDRGTGKSSLIVTAAADTFAANVPRLLPPTRLPEDFYPDRVPITIIDTSSNPEDRGKLAAELKRADAVVLTYACDQPETLNRLSTFWLPELRQLEVKVPVIVVGCRLDLRDELQQVSLEQVMSPIMQQFREIETCIECSAYKHIQIPEVFYYAQKAVLHPTGPLFDQESQTLKPRCVRALKRIFILCDHDRDGALSDAELNDFQSVELTNEAIEFLKGVYELFDSDLDNNLRPIEVEDVFSTAPESPWNDAPYKDAAEKTALGGLSLDAFLSEWALMTLLDPARSVENLIYIGYPGDPSSAIRVTRRRRLDRKKQQSERNVFQCFLLGPTNAGKSALMNSFLGRPYSDSYSPTTDERYAVNVVELPGGIKKTLVLREIPEDGVRKLLSTKDSLAACDIAVFVHDSSDESSWKRATELLVDVAGHGEDTGYEVSQDMGIDAPIPISSKLGDFNNIFRKIVNAAEYPHLSIPETEAGRSRKQYHRLINRSLMFVSGMLIFWHLTTVLFLMHLKLGVLENFVYHVGAAVAIVGLAAYRVYAARKNASS
ncbi:Small GTPase - like 10 [Theobroma cacao]|nr:Small GTPase - like 10 [Theobroma cacao]